MAFKGYKGYNGKSGKNSGIIFPTIDLQSLISSISLTEETNLVVNEYHNQGYNGTFGTNAIFEWDVVSSKCPAAILRAPEYSKYMLYGRGPGKMPPMEPIDFWMTEQGLTGNSWGIRKHIAEYGTSGNDFITPLLPELQQNISSKISKVISQAIASKK